MGIGSKLLTSFYVGLTEFCFTVRPSLQSQSKILLIAIPTLLSLSSVFDVFAPFALSRLVDQVVLHSIKFTLIWMFAFFSAEATTRLAQVATQILYAKFSRGMLRTLSLRVYQHTLSMPYQWFLDQHIGSIIKIISDGTASVRTIQQGLVFAIIPTAIQLLFISIVLFKKYGLTLIILEIFLFTSYLLIYLNRTPKQQNIASKAYEIDLISSATLVEALTANELVKTSFAERYFGRRFEENLLNSQRSWLAFFRFQAVSRLYLSFLYLTTLASSLAFILFLQKFSKVSAGDVVLVTYYLFQVTVPVERIGNAIRDFSQSFVALHKLNEILNAVPEDLSGEEIDSDGGFEIEARNLSFGYNERCDVLNSISFSVKYGKTIAFVGSTGSGKSTIYKLLMKLYRPNPGQLYVGGRDLLDISTKSIRKEFSVVPQKPIIFDDTLAANLLISAPSATREDMMRVINRVSLGKKFDAMPDGIDTRLGNKGMKLSGGEQQKLAIARLLLRPAKVIILDEATSSLDSLSESSIIKIINEEFSDCSKIIIAHRLRAVKEADQIYVLEQGSIVESGTHLDLISRHGLYQRMWIEQVGEHLTAH